MTAIDPALRALIALSLAAIFGVSAAAKFADLDIFESSLANYRLAPRALERPLAYLVPIGEGACAIALVFAATRPAAAVGLVILLAAFTAAIAINLARGRINIDCGCFGPMLRQPLSAWLMLRNLVLAAFAAALLLPAGGRALVQLDYATIAFGAATLLVLYAAANYALSNAPVTRMLASS
jgi:uncharacterized membrane protein YphA (DoxX/SURF4 family)